MNGFALYWREPFWLLLISLPLFGAAISQSVQRWRWRKIVEPSMRQWAAAQQSSGKNYYARLFMFFAWIMFSIALASPRTPKMLPPDVIPGKSQIMIVIDQSASMRARDDSISRLAHVQQSLEHWMRDLPNGVMVGLTIFSGREHILLRPTSDRELLAFFIDALPEIRAPIAGNAVGKALEESSSVFLEQGGEGFLLLLTDGDIGELEQKKAAVVSKFLREAGIRLVVVGFGTQNPVLVPDEDGRPMMYKGTRVTTQRDTQWLEEFSREAAGRYFDGSEGAEQAISHLLDFPKPVITAQDAQRVLWREWFGLPLLLGLLAVFITLHFSDADRPKASAKLSAALLLLFTLTSCGINRPSSWEQEGMAAIDANNFAQAKEIYGAQTGYAARFGEGVACFHLQDLICAQAAFARAAWDAPDDRLRGRAVFNLGNTHFQLGEYAQASVLFAEAQSLGVAAHKAELNREFSDALEVSVTKYETDIAKALRRAAFRAQSGQVSRAKMRGQISRIINFPGRFETPPILQSLSSDELDELLLRGVAVLDMDIQRTESGNLAKRWIKVAQQRASGGLAQVMNPLLAMEAGLATVPDVPRKIDGERPW